MHPSFTKEKKKKEEKKENTMLLILFTYLLLVLATTTTTVLLIAAIILLLFMDKLIKNMFRMLHFQYVCRKIFHNLNLVLTSDYMIFLLVENNMQEFFNFDV